MAATGSRDVRRAQSGLPHVAALGLKLGIQRYLSDDRFQGHVLIERASEAEFSVMNPLASGSADAVQYCMKA
jgi:hypothetical protein